MSMSAMKAWFASTALVTTIAAGPALAQVPVDAPPAAPLPAGLDALAKAVDALPKPGESYGRDVSALVDAFPTFLGDGTQYEDDIVIEGSDSVAVMLVRAAKAWSMLQPQCDVTVHQGSTDRGLQALLAAQSVAKVTPRILIAPGFTHQRPTDPDDSLRQLANPVVAELRNPVLKNWNGYEVGQMRPAAALG